MSTINLVPVFNGKIQNNSLQLCNARELHSFLKSKYDYSNWINKRITDYGFVENEDYIIVTTRTQGRPRKDYHITLDMGKELAMVERNEKGRLIRKYFIECERTLKKQTQRPTYSPPDFHLVAKNHSIQNGRYLVVIKNGQAFIKPIQNGAIVDAHKYRILKHNLKLLAQQLGTIDASLTAEDALNQDLLDL